MQDYWLISSLSGLAAALHKFAFDLRILQAPSFKTLAEPFGDNQIGSSAMPFKRNPIGSEKVCSLARYVFAFTNVAWTNASSSLLERTLDDSANRRSTIPEAFLACDEMLNTCHSILTKLEIDRVGIAEILDYYGPFSATERLLSALVREGANRQEMHEIVREHSLRAWEVLGRGEPNPLIESLCSDTTILTFLQPTRIRDLMTIESYVGLAPERARDIVKRILDKFPPIPAEGEESIDAEASEEGSTPPEGEG
jgi:adenylosuccinate lyase